MRQDVNQSITYGADAVFTITATGTGLSYKWQEDRGSGFANITNGGIYSNSATAALNITKPTVSENGYKYRCVITGTCGTATSNGTATLTVSKKALLITAVVKTKEYDGAIFPVTDYTVTYSGFIAGEDETDLTGTISFTGTAVTAVNSGAYVITPGALTSVNYSITYVNGSLDITKRTLTITADNKSKTYGETNPSLTVSYSGFVAGDNSSAITAPSVSTTAVTGSSAGTYPITLSGGTTANYIFTLVNGVMTVNKATATVTLGNLSYIYNGTAKVATATTSPAGLTVNLKYNGSSAAPVNAGTYTVVGTISNNNYQGSASGIMVIGKAPQIITFSDIPSGLRITEEHQLEASASSGLSVSFVSSNSNIVSISGTVMTVKGDGTITLTASQSGNN